MMVSGAPVGVTRSTTTGGWSFGADDGEGFVPPAGRVRVGAGVGSGEFAFEVLGKVAASGAGEGDGVGAGATAGARDGCTRRASTTLPDARWGALDGADASSPNTRITAQSVTAPTLISNVMPFRIAFEEALQPPVSRHYKQ